MKFSEPFFRTSALSVVVAVSWKQETSSQICSLLYSKLLHVLSCSFMFDFFPWLGEI